jgi:hypothetical protein
MGGVTKLFSRPEVAKQVQEVSKPAPPAEKPISQQMDEDRSARRRARRGGRAMLSDTRLNPEQGVTTLGSVVQ